jgi:protein-tyrosine phosphatase
MTDTLPLPDFVSDDLTELKTGLPGRLFRGPMPLGAFDGRKILLQRIREENVQVIVPLIEVGEDVRKTGLELIPLYRQAGYTVFPSPIPDFSTPKPGQLDPVVDQVALELQAGRNVLVHCNAGYGRTGIFMGVFARRILGLSGKSAIHWVRWYIPVALENAEQVAFVIHYPGKKPGRFI